MELEWISVADRLPEIQEPVLVFLPKYGTPNIQTMWLADWSDGTLWFCVHFTTKNLDEVTHWHPLPKPPNK